MSKMQADDPIVARSTRRWQQAGVWLLLVLVLSFPMYKLTEDSRRASATSQRDQAQIAAGTQLWAGNCAVCHGPMGEGVDAPALNSQEFLTTVTDAQIRDIMRGGVPGTEMPAWLSDYGGPLTEEQIQALVVFMRSWEPTAPPRPDWRTLSGG